MVWIATLTLLLGYNVPAHGINYGWLALLLVIRDGLLIGLAGLVVREMWCPWLDVVRVDGVDDPSGGVFDGAPDYWQRDVDDAEGPAPGDGRDEEQYAPAAAGQIDLRK
jgi:hypothetical protein